MAIAQVDPLAVPIVTTNAAVPLGAEIVGVPPPQPDEIVGAVTESAMLTNFNAFATTTFCDVSIVIAVIEFVWNDIIDETLVAKYIPPGSVLKSPEYPPPLAVLVASMLKYPALLISPMVASADAPAFVFVTGNDVLAFCELVSESELKAPALGVVPPIGGGVA